MTIKEIIKKKSFNELCEEINKVYKMNEHEKGTCMIIYNYINKEFGKEKSGYKIRGENERGEYKIYAYKGEEKKHLKDLSIEEIMSGEIIEEFITTMIMIMLSKINGDISGIIYNIELFIAKGLT